MAQGVPPLPALDHADGQRLVLHIGHSKTGSTAIQDALARGQMRCAGKRLIYPAHRNHMPLARTITDPHLAGEHDARFTQLRDRLDRADWDVAVISSEQFEFAPPERVLHALETYLAPGCRGCRSLSMYARMCRVWWPIMQNA